jgi:hypothetical protein
VNAGYSSTPLAKKLGIKPGGVVHLSGAPRGFAKLLEPLPAGVRFVSAISADTDIAHFKVCAVDETWSGLKLVLRKELRGGRGSTG